MDIHRLRRTLRSRRGKRNLFLGGVFFILIFVVYLHFVSIASLHTVASHDERARSTSSEGAVLPPKLSHPKKTPPPTTLAEPVIEAETEEATEAETTTEEPTTPEEVVEATTLAPPTTTEAPTEAPVIVESTATSLVAAQRKPLTPKADEAEKNVEQGEVFPRDNTKDKREDPFDRKISHSSFEQALNMYFEKLKINITDENPSQPTKSFKDINELPDHGVLLPHDPSEVPDPRHYEACDARDAEFETPRDQLCQQYLGNVNNMRSIKALSSLLYSGRTLKFKIFYRHNQIEAIVKVSQMKFFFEAASEHLAFAIDRALNLSYVPTTAYFPLPVDYMRAAAGVMPTFYTQWFNLFVPTYEFTRLNFAACESGTPYAQFVITSPSNSKLSQETVKQLGTNLPSMKKRCSLVAAQLWMKDVHSALNTNLAFPHEYSEKNARKFWRPIVENDGEAEGALGTDKLRGGKVSRNKGRVVKYTWPPVRPHRLQALGDICDRFIFDFLLGNTDRGLNDHNNFVYGGCDHSTECTPKGPENSIKGPAKYAFIDHGSSFYSHREPEGNPFTGNASLICRFRRKTYASMKFYDSDQEEEGPYYKDKALRIANGEVKSSTKQDSRPIVSDIRNRLLPPGIFGVIRMSIFKKVQERLQKILKIVDGCVDKFGEEEVFSL